MRISLRPRRPSEMGSVQSASSPNGQTAPHNDAHQRNGRRDTVRSGERRTLVGEHAQQAGFSLRVRGEALDAFLNSRAHGVQRFGQWLQDADEVLQCIEDRHTGLGPLDQRLGNQCQIAPHSVRDWTVLDDV